MEQVQERLTLDYQIQIQDLDYYNIEYKRTTCSCGKHECRASYVYKIYPNPNYKFYILESSIISRYIGDFNFWSDTEVLYFANHKNFIIEESQSGLLIVKRNIAQMKSARKI